MKLKFEETINNLLNDLKSRGIEKIVAFSGGLPSTELESRARRIIKESIDVFKNYPIAIQTGGTNFDIQKYAVEIGKGNNLFCIGIFPSRGLKYKMDGLDFELEIPPRYGDSQWCDETEIYSKLPNAIEVIGGSCGTLAEFAHVIKVNDDLMKRGGEPKYIAPITFQGLETTADFEYSFPLKSQQKEAVHPTKIIEDGTVAANWIINKLRLKKVQQ